MTEGADVRVRELNLYRRYFALVVAGRKTIEVRVKYPHLEALVPGDVIRFRVQGTDGWCDVQFKRVTEYGTFEELLDAEGVGNINPASSREQQLTDIREIHPAKKEALGALAVRIEPLPQ
ncbi:ASCH domain-containing protein [Streptomyces cadmiisoli]|uniref:ASCH domain-containing protein n=1 Tax=Streptomyces cadmiisoli TaxID=2184053 RepID=UPI003D71DBBB